MGWFCYVERLDSQFRECNSAHIGDTLHRVGSPVDPMPGFKPAKAMVYAGVFPVDSNDFLKLEESIKRVRTDDLSFSAKTCPMTIIIPSLH